MAGNLGLSVRERAIADGTLLMQITWAGEDAMQRAKYASQIGKVPGWLASDMLDPTVNDAKWLDEWLAQLADSAGVLIIRSETYREKFESNPRSALRKEARAIMKRKAADSSFKIYALDPGNSSQGCTSIRGLLLDEKLEEGYLGWNKWANKWIDTTRARAAGKRTMCAIHVDIPMPGEESAQQVEEETPPARPKKPRPNKSAMLMASWLTKKAPAAGGGAAAGGAADL